MKQFLFVVILVNIILMPMACQDKDETALVENQQKLVIQEEWTTRYIDYSAFDSLSVILNSGIEKIPVVDLDKYTQENIDYESLLEKAEIKIMSSECRGDLSCWTRCMPLKEIIIVTGIPNNCDCYRSEDGLAIICRGSCPSYIIQCGGGVHR